MLVMGGTAISTRRRAGKGEHAKYSRRATRDINDFYIIQSQVSVVVSQGQCVPSVCEVCLEKKETAGVDIIRIFWEC